MSATPDRGVGGIDGEIEAAEASLAKPTQGDAPGANAPSVADEAIREIGQQVSQALFRWLPSGTGKFALDIHGAVDMYGNHLRTHQSLGAARANIDGSENKNERAVWGRNLEVSHVHDQKMAGQESYTTDELAIMKKNGDPEWDRLLTQHPEVASLAQSNHEHTDVVTFTKRGIVTAQVKNLDEPSDYFRAFKEDANNDRFVVPMDKYEAVKADLERRAREGGEDGHQAKEFLQKLESASASRWATKNPRLAHAGKATRDAATRAGYRIAEGVAIDIALVAIGGVAWEIREFYRSPATMTLWERVDRLLRVVWNKIKAVFKDRALREIGFEALSAGVSMLTAPLKMAKAALEKIWRVIQRLWMDFVEGRVKSLAEVVSAILKAVYSVACIGVAIAVERSLANVLGVVPGGEMLSAVLAAAVAGVIVIIGNRGIETIVQGLALLSSRAELARRRRVEIERVCAQVIPQMIADRDQLEGLIDQHLAEHRLALDRSFANMSTAKDAEDVTGFLDGLKALNAAYGKALQWNSQAEFDTLMLSDEPLRIRPARR